MRATVALRLPDRWIWDFWFASDGECVHVFYLHAPRLLGDPELRHRFARIGHAVSVDLRSWSPLPPPLPDSVPGSPDDLATWTGSVVRGHDGQWHLFYTGLSGADAGTVQRVLAATSADLLHWRRGAVRVEADPRWYEKRSPEVAAESWRDPYVLWDEGSRRWHMLVTARAPTGPRDGRAVIGHAPSADLQDWQVHPPLTRPGQFRNMEVPQLVRLGGAWRLLFSAGVDDHSAARLAATNGAAPSGTYCLTVPHALFAGHPPDAAGPDAAGLDGAGLDGAGLDGAVLDGGLEVASLLVGDPSRRHYAGRLLHHLDRWWYFAWLERDKQGRFVGELSDPMPVEVRPDGLLHVDPP